MGASSSVSASSVPGMLIGRGAGVGRDGVPDIDDERLDFGSGRRCRLRRHRGFLVDVGLCRDNSNAVGIEVTIVRFHNGHGNLAMCGVDDLGGEPTAEVWKRGRGLELILRRRQAGLGQRCAGERASE